MVAFEGDRPVAVLIGCKRPPETLVRTLAVHPGHLRRGHGRHLLTSLSAKLAILGPPNLVAEVPAANAPARALFAACGWRETQTYRDLEFDPSLAAPAPSGTVHEVRPDSLPAVAGPLSWERTQATLAGRRERLKALVLAPADRIEAAVAYTREADGAIGVWRMEGAGLGTLLRDLAHRERTRIVALGVGYDECPWELATTIGWRATGETIGVTSVAKAQ